MGTVEEYIFVKENNQREILRCLHDLLTQELGLHSKIRFKIPFYKNRNWICYLNPIKKDGIELAFIRGNELSNNHALLHCKGRKQVCGIEFYATDNIPKVVVTEIIQEAIILDEVPPHS